MAVAKLCVTWSFLYWIPHSIVNKRYTKYYCIVSDNIGKIDRGALDLYPWSSFLNVSDIKNLTYLHREYPELLIVIIYMFSENGTIKILKKSSPFSHPNFYRYFVYLYYFHFFNMFSTAIFSCSLSDSWRLTEKRAI